MHKLSGYRGDVTISLRSHMQGVKLSASALEKYPYMREHFELPEQQFIRKWVLSGDHVFDVGGHIGFMALYFASLGAKVCTFEPSPISFGRLQHNLALNPKLEITPYNVGASDCDAVGYLSPCGSMSALGWSGNEVHLIRLAPLMKVLRPSFLKIDVEGHAGSVIRGMALDAMDTSLPILMIETHNTGEHDAVVEHLSGTYDLVDLDHSVRFPRRIGCVPKCSPRVRTSECR